MNQFFLEINKVEKAPNYPLHDLRLFVIEEKYCKPQISLLVGLNKLLYYLNLTGGIIILAKPSPLKYQKFLDKLGLSCAQHSIS